MANVAYDFLSESILFHEDELNDGFSDLNDDKLLSELELYREHCLKNIDTFIQEASNLNSNLKVLSSVEEMPYDLLKQGALYFDQFIIYDPLFSMTYIPGKSAKVISESLGFDSKKLDREKLVESLTILKAITPMVASGYVKMLPLSKVFEPPKELALTLPENYYSDILPPELLDYCRSKVVLRSLRQDGKLWRIMDELDYTPCITISFEDYDNNGKVNIFHYHETEFYPIEGTNKVRFEQKLASYPVDKIMWNAWVTQSINSSAISVVDKIKYENYVANTVGANYLTNNEFTSGLLSETLKIEPTFENECATEFLRLNLPFLDEIDCTHLMQVRNNEGELFEKFRNDLDRNLRDLRLIKDPVELRKSQENMLHDLKIQTANIGKRLRQLREKALLEGLIAAGGLFAAVQTGGWSLVSTIPAALSGYKTLKEYRDNLRNNPSYFLWKVLR